MAPVHDALPRVCFLLVLTFLGWTSGCQFGRDSQGLPIQWLFEGFQLILTDDLPPNAPIQTLEASTLRDRHPGDQFLVPGRIYSFRKMTGAGNEELAITILPDRLAKFGAKVTKAPKTEKDFMYPFVGGPIFLIEFEKDGHHGTIFNRAHVPQGDPAWEELVVALQ
jgi:hypothetical protein